MQPRTRAGSKRKGLSGVSWKASSYLGLSWAIFLGLFLVLIFFLRVDKSHTRFEEKLVNEAFLVGSAISFGLFLHEFEQIDILFGQIQIDLRIAHVHERRGRNRKKEGGQIHFR